MIPRKFEWNEKDKELKISPVFELLKLLISEYDIKKYCYKYYDNLAIKGDRESLELNSRKRDDFEREKAVLSQLINKAFVILDKHEVIIPEDLDKYRSIIKEL